ncbi:putative antigenic protein [Trypanosoma cruzi]|uniref:Putative antigenic protein n=1 Tax=Trypanosoma cruzi TaxID=5693 RepID=A0A2V2VV33_TRYCR|nr:putative antigenic protein [Trypanosoma cruzi]
MLIEPAPRLGDELSPKIPSDVISVGSPVAFDVLTGNSWCYETGIVTFLSDYIARVSVSHADPRVNEKELLEMNRKKLAELCGMLQQVRARVVRDHYAALQRRIDYARLKVKGIESACIREIQSYVVPPPTVKYIVEDVIEIIGIRNECYGWPCIQAIIRRPEFISLVSEFDSSRLSMVRRSEILQRCMSRRLTSETAYKSSQAAGPLHLWVLAQLSFFEECESPSPLTDEYSREQLERLFFEIKALQSRIRLLEGDPGQSIPNSQNEEKIILRSSIIGAIPTNYDITKMAAVHRPELLKYIASSPGSFPNNYLLEELRPALDSYGETHILRDSPEKGQSEIKIDVEKEVQKIESENSKLQQEMNVAIMDRSRRLQPFHDWDKYSEQCGTQTRELQVEQQLGEAEDLTRTFTEMQSSIDCIRDQITEVNIDKNHLEQELIKMRKINDALRVQSENYLQRKMRSGTQQELEVLRHVNAELKKENDALRTLSDAHEGELVRARREVAHLYLIIATLSAKWLEHGTSNVSTIHQISLDGDVWEDILSNYPQELLRALTCDVIACCGAHAECVSGVTCSHGRLRAEFNVTHSADRRSEGIDELISLYQFPLTRSLCTWQNIMASPDTEYQKTVSLQTPLCQDGLVASSYDRKMEDLIRRNEDLQALLKDSRCSMEKMQSVVATITDRNNEWEREITERQRQIVLLQASLDEATSERTFAENRIADLQRTVENLQNQLNVLENAETDYKTEMYKQTTKKEPLEACAKNDSPGEDFPITQIGKLNPVEKEMSSAKQLTGTKKQEKAGEQDDLEKPTTPYINYKTEKNYTFTSFGPKQEKMTSRRKNISCNAEPQEKHNKKEEDTSAFKKEREANVKQSDNKQQSLQEMFVKKQEEELQQFQQKNKDLQKTENEQQHAKSKIRPKTSKNEKQKEEAIPQDKLRRVIKKTEQHSIKRHITEETKQNTIPIKKIPAPNKDLHENPKQNSDEQKHAMKTMAGLQRQNEELQSQLREACRGQEKLDALQRHNEELQSQLKEACRGQEKLTRAVDNEIDVAAEGGVRGQEKLDAVQRHNEELQSQLREACRGQEKLDALQRHNEELQSQLREACRGQEKLDALQRHNEELQSQLKEARRGQEKLESEEETAHN